MAEIAPDMSDDGYPTPVSLEQLSAIAISLEIWRNEVRKYRTSNTLRKFKPFTMEITSKTIFSYVRVPAVINEVIEKHVSRFGYCFQYWLIVHHAGVFRLHGRHKNSVLEVFNDFVADHDGDIDYVRTAERMMRCDGFSEAEKFTIACTYFFEEDIMRIWPSVCEIFDLINWVFHENPQLYYWICVLSNQLDEIAFYENSSVDEIMLQKCMRKNRPSFDYFWNRIPPDNRMRNAVNLFQINVASFIKFVLPKLDDQQLRDFVGANDCELILAVLHNGCFCDDWLFLPAWNCIRNKINENVFRRLVVKMLKLEGGDASWNLEPKIWRCFCFEIWNSITPNLKQSIVKDVLSDRQLFEYAIPRHEIFLAPRCFEFLSMILSCARLEQRSVFWHNFWSYFIHDVRFEDSQRIMKLCFENDDAIAHFKRDIIAESRIMSDCWVVLLRSACFDELNALVDFVCPEAQAARNLKQRLLRSDLSPLIGNSWLDYDIITNFKQFSTFIDDAFNDANLSADYKNQFISSPENQEIVAHHAYDESSSVMEFVDTFVSTERTAKRIKMRIIDSLLQRMSIDRDVQGDEFLNSLPRFSQLFLWCSGNVEKV